LKLVSLVFSFICVEKTVIIVPPTNETVDVDSDVTLHCNATTDPSERRKLEIIWMMHGYPIDFASQNNVRLYTVDKSLVITRARIDNTGSYTCNATNGLDWDAVTVRVTVRGSCRFTFCWPVKKSTSLVASSLPLSYEATGKIDYFCPFVSGITLKMRPSDVSCGIRFEQL
jgi:hypothetical protein